MSISGRLVTHKRKFGRFNLMSLLTSSRTLSRGGGNPVVWGQPGCAGTFIECVNNEIDWDCSWEPEHVFEALQTSKITGLF